MPPAPSNLPILGRPELRYQPLPDVSRDALAVAALYVHVPFCTTKCHYCDFYSIAGHLDQVDDYIAALAREIALQTHHFGVPAPQTIFIGGGTPTLLDPSALDRLLNLLLRSIDRSRLQEFTIEANPNTFDAARAAVVASHGINRISFGAQSFNTAELQTLQRDHDPENVPRAVDTARAAGIDNINIDLIFGIPGQTMATWDNSLRRALDCRPHHMSCYSLIYESNTAMTARLKKGEFKPIEEALELEMFQHVYTLLRSHGFERYEVSNYAQPGRRCQHNLHYWTGTNYLAWGPAAAAHVAGHRWKNVPSLARYLDALQGPSPQIPIVETEHLSPRKRAGELAVLRLRLSDGLNYADFQSQTGIDPRPPMHTICKKYAGLGLLHETAEGIALTESAIAVSDSIMAAVLAAF
jgi:oxygen-independent coproporphyrinogen III oxidase